MGLPEGKKSVVHTKEGQNRVESWCHARDAAFPSPPLSMTSSFAGTFWYSSITEPLG